MSYFLFFCELLPAILDVFGLYPPLLANDLGYLWIGESWVLRDDLGLVVLSV